MEPPADWEDTKENYVPVKQGRSAAALSTPLSVSKRSNEVEEARKSFLDTIKSSQDPLPAWMKYIKWAQEQFAANGIKAELQQVLEAATRSLSSTDRYNSDVRLLRIWVQYADCLPDPSDVFMHLAKRNIGRDHALLYEAYATYLELKGNFQQAELVYQDGINRLAKPVERLKQKLAAFQQRMAKRIQRQTAEGALGMDTAAAALESMNQMFSGDSATMTLPRDAIANAAGAGNAAAYGAASSRAGGRRPGGGSGCSSGSAEPTVTINTRAALDAMNGMFGCSDDTTTMHGFSQQSNRAHAAAAAGGGGGGVRYGGSYGGMPGSGGSSSGAEPTVTINTRAAFDAMNDMFGDATGQQTLTGRQMGMAHGRGDRRAGTSRLSMAAGGGMAGMGAGMGLYEDTEFVMESPAVRAALAERPSLALSPVASMPSPGFGAQENSNPGCGNVQPAPLRSLHDTAAKRDMGSTPVAVPSREFPAPSTGGVLGSSPKQSSTPASAARKFYKRLQYDVLLDQCQFSVGLLETREQAERKSGAEAWSMRLHSSLLELPFTEFLARYEGEDVPFHRIVWFKQSGAVVWEAEHLKMKLAVSFELLLQQQGEDAGRTAAAAAEGGEEAVLADYTMLPEECWLDVLQRLGVKELCYMSRVSRTLRGLAARPFLWSTAYERLFGAMPPADWSGQTVKRLCRRSELRSSRWVEADVELKSVGLAGTWCCQLDDAKVLSGDGCCVRLWSHDTGRRIATLRGHTGRVTAVAFDDDLIMSGCSQGTVKLWSMDELKLSKTLRHHTDAVSATALLHGLPISAGKDGCVCVWDAAAPNSPLVVLEAGGPVHALQLQEEKGQLISATSSLAVWDMSTTQLLFNLACRQRGLVGPALPGSSSSTSRGMWGGQPLMSLAVPNRVTCFQFHGQNLLVGQEGAECCLVSLQRPGSGTARAAAAWGYGGANSSNGHAACGSAGAGCHGMSPGSHVPYGYDESGNVDEAGGRSSGKGKKKGAKVPAKKQTRYPKRTTR
ncbi:Mad3/BUB1 homology region 1-domain-containing protein [Scenedesmus sp. NREL 46B-D3]|nr:Mad3/BUB1 homology region 1-domain-containing protein [Scenedesmus sp. NREL 46B-D3]